MSELQDRIEELLFRLRRDDEQMNALLSSGHSHWASLSTNIMLREDVIKALEDMLRASDVSDAPARKVKVTLSHLFKSQQEFICNPGERTAFQVPDTFGSMFRVEWAE